MHFEEEGWTSLLDRGGDQGKDELPLSSLLHPHLDNPGDITA